MSPYGHLGVCNFVARYAYRPNAVCDRNVCPQRQPNGRAAVRYRFFSVFRVSPKSLATAKVRPCCLGGRSPFSGSCFVGSRELGRPHRRSRSPGPATDFRPRSLPGVSPVSFHPLDHCHVSRWRSPTGRSDVFPFRGRFEATSAIARWQSRTRLAVWSQPRRIGRVFPACAPGRRLTGSNLIRRWRMVVLVFVIGRDGPIPRTYFWRGCPFLLSPRRTSPVTSRVSTRPRRGGRS